MTCQHLCVQASFVATGNRTDISLEDPDFWQKWAKKAELDLDAINGRVGPRHPVTSPMCPFFFSFFFFFGLRDLTFLLAQAP